MADLTVIVPVRDRSGARLQNCLTSLRWQTLGSERVHIVVSDFGSTPEHSASVDHLAATHDARVVRTPTDEVWNRSRALNLALRTVPTPWMLATDADMIFEPNFLETVLDRLAAGRRLVVCRCHDLPEGVTPKGPLVATGYQELRTLATVRPSGGTGACQATSTEWIRSIGGYDERYVYWGFEDKDLVSRARRDGLNVDWVHDHTSMLHQWHPHMGRQRRLIKYRNKLRFWLTRFFVRKGPPLPGPANQP